MKHLFVLTSILLFPLINSGQTVVSITDIIKDSKKSDNSTQTRFTHKPVKKTADGLLYKIIKDEPGNKYPKINDIIKIHISIRIGDSVLLNSRQINNNAPFELPIQLTTFKGDWLGGLLTMTPGDRAIFYVPVQMAKQYSQEQFPKFVKESDMIEYDVQLVTFAPAVEAEREQEANDINQKVVDDEKLQAYFAQKGIQPRKTVSGLYYIIDYEGSGNLIKRGQKVEVRYTGSNLDGKTFDSNINQQFNHVEPFSFIAGLGEVIPGWDEGIQLLKEGSKARFFIPSNLGYGSQNMGPDIGANAVLVFSVEVTNVTN